MKTLVFAAVFASLLAGGVVEAATIADLLREPGDCSANQTVCVWMPGGSRAQTASVNADTIERLARIWPALMGVAQEHGAPTDVGTSEYPATPVKVVFCDRQCIQRYLPQLAPYQYMYENGAIVVNLAVVFAGEFIRNNPPEHGIGRVAYGELEHYVSSLTIPVYPTIDGWHPWLRQQAGVHPTNYRMGDFDRVWAVADAIIQLSRDARFRNLVIKQVMRRLGEPCPPNAICTWELEPE
ncbi:hypothetical protein HYV91_00510 [Candidatus Wolfebacteria bacterium]|nr:hypothetical protein [Candidatus Wolfebacteria bacterium]